MKVRKGLAVLLSVCLTASGMGYTAIDAKAKDTVIKKLTVKVGKTKRIIIKGKGIQAKKFKVVKGAWVASVSKKGVVRGKRAGSAKVQVRLKIGRKWKKYDVRVTVQDTKPADITMEPVGMPAQTPVGIPGKTPDSTGTPGEIPSESPNVTEMPGEAPSMLPDVTEAPDATAAPSEKGYTLVIEDGVLKGYNGTLTNVVVPDGVTEIADGFKSNCMDAVDGYYNTSDFSSLSLPASCTKIGSDAFDHCNFLQEVTFRATPEQALSIGESAFYHCSRMESFDFAGSVKYIGRGAFGESGIERLDVTLCPDSGTIPIDKSAFRECSLKSVVIKMGENVAGATDFGKEQTFYGCRHLKSVSIQGNWTGVPIESFYSCDSLESVELPDTITKIGMYAFTYCHNLRSITLPDSLTALGIRCFEETGIESIHLGTKMEDIGEYCFCNCQNLKTVEIGNTGVNLKDGFAFYLCKALESVSSTVFSESCTHEHSGVVTDDVLGRQRKVCWDCGTVSDWEIMTD